MPWLCPQADPKLRLNAFVIHMVGVGVCGGMWFSNQPVAESSLACTLVSDVPTPVTRGGGGQVEAHPPSESCSVGSDSLRSHGVLPTSFLYPWDSSGKNTGVGCHALLLDLLDPGNKLGSPIFRADSLPSEPPGKSTW